MAFTTVDSWLAKLATKKRNDEGFSLAEVIIAMVILVVAGGILLNGLVSNQRLNTKVNTQSLRLSSLLTGAETVTAAPFTGCKKDSPVLPYSDLAMPTNVTIEKVEWFSPVKVWESCTKKPDTAPSIQRVILKYQSGAVIMRRTVLKIFGADTNAYTAGYSVKIINPATNTALSAVKREMGPTNPSRADSMTASLTLTATANTSNTCYSILPAYKLAVEAFISSPDGTGCGSSTTINVKNLKTTNPDGSVTYAPAGTYALDIAGFDPVSGGIAYPATLVIRVRPSMQIDALMECQGSGSSWVAAGNPVNSGSLGTCTSFKTKAARITFTPFPGTGTFNYTDNREWGIGFSRFTPNTWAPTVVARGATGALLTSTRYEGDATNNQIIVTIPARAGCSGTLTFLLDPYDFGLGNTTSLGSVTADLTC